MALAHWQAALGWYKVLLKAAVKEEECAEEPISSKPGDIASVTAPAVGAAQQDQGEGEGAQQGEQVEKGKREELPPALQRPVDNQVPVSAVSPAAEAINKAAAEGEMRVVSNVAQAEGIRAGTFHEDAAWQFEYEDKTARTGAESQSDSALQKMAEDLSKRKPPAAVAKAVKDGTGDMENNLRKMIENTQESLGHVAVMQDALKKGNEAAEKPVSEVAEEPPQVPDSDSDDSKSTDSDPEDTPPKAKGRGKGKAKASPKPKGRGRATAKAKAKREPKKKGTPKRKAAAKSNTLPKSFAQTLSSQVGETWQHWLLPVLRYHLF